MARVAGASDSRRNDAGARLPLFPIAKQLRYIPAGANPGSLPGQNLKLGCEAPHLIGWRFDMTHAPHEHRSIAILLLVIVLLAMWFFTHHYL